MLAIKNLSWSAATSVGGAVFDILKIVVLTRYLGPEDFGVFAIALIVMGFSQLFSEGGVGNALVSKKTVTAEQAGDILNFNMLISFVIYLLILVSAPLIASYYLSPQLSTILPIIGLSVPLSAYARILQAMLQRSLDMEAIAKATLLAKLVGLLIAVILAFWNFGIYALVISTLVTSLLSVILMCFPASGSIRYSLGIRWENIKPILSFSIFQLGEFLLNFFAKNFDVLLITKLLGAEASGIYVVAKNLLVRVGDVLVSTFSRFFHPKLAKIQLDGAKLTFGYLQFFRCTTFSVVVAYLAIALNHLLFVQLLLGDKYTAASELVFLMTIWLSLRYCTAPIATLWLVKQKPQIGLYWNIIVAAVVPATVYLSYQFGLKGVILGLTFVQVGFLISSLILSFFLLSRMTAVTVKQLIWIGLLLTCSLPVYLLVDTTATHPAILLVSSMVGALALLYWAWLKRALFFKDTE